jgi:hypothetical protein
MAQSSRLALTIACAAVGLFALRATAQQQAGRPPAQPQQVAADPNDVSSIDAIIAALYDANTTIVDQKQGVDRLRSLVVPEVRFEATVRRGSDGQRELFSRTLEPYIQSASAGQPRHGLSEREIKRTTEAFGHIVQAFSTYETHRDSADKQLVHGINSIQLFNDGKRWWIVTVYWQHESAKCPIPEKYLPGSRGLRS